MKRLLIVCGLVFILFGCKFSPDYNSGETIVAICFDDNCKSVYTYALPVMQKYNCRGTVFTNSGTVGQVDRLSWTQLDSLKHLYNWEIGGHTVNHEHLPDLTPSQAETAISNDFEILKQRGLNPKSFAVPCGICPVDYYHIISRYYKNIRTSFNLSMHSPLDRTFLGTFSNSNLMTSGDMINRVMQGIVDKENLIILTFHDVNPSLPDYTNNCEPLIFAEIITKLHEMGVKVLPLNEALEYLKD
jgi:peptidoglycan/xylan/chitin deacetylase (PgdA/CDA1 family)